MNYLLSMPKNQYERINRYFKESAAGEKAAFLLTKVDEDGKQCTINITDFVAVEDPEKEARPIGFGIQSPALMEAIDRAMESCKSFLFLYSDRDAGEGAFNPMKRASNQIVFRIAYHYLPFGLHACIAYSDSGLKGSAWLKDSTLRPMQIQIQAS